MNICTIHHQTRKYLKDCRGRTPCRPWEARDGLPYDIFRVMAVNKGRKDDVTIPLVRWGLLRFARKDMLEARTKTPFWHVFLPKIISAECQNDSDFGLFGLTS